MSAVALDALPPEGRALLDAVRATPDDDVPRMVLAAWLCARGDPRGDLIRVQCGLRAGLNPAERLSLRREERALLSAHQKDWLAPYATPSLRLTLARGFVEQALCWDPTKAADALGRLFASEPVRSLELRAYNGLGKALRAVIDAGWIARLERLALGGGYDPATLEVLAEALAGSTVTRLAPGGGGRGLAAALVRAGVVARLRTLTLPRETDDDAMESLAGSPPGLQSLYLPGAAVGDRGIEALVNSSVMEGISTLCANRCRALGDAGVRALAGSPRSAALSWLELADTGVGEEGAAALAGSAHLVSLKRLDVRGTGAARGPGAAALRARWPGKVRVR